MAVNVKATPMAKNLALHAAGEWELFKLRDASSAYFTSQYMSWGNLGAMANKSDKLPSGNLT